MPDTDNEKPSKPKYKIFHMPKDNMDYPPFKVTDSGILRNIKGSAYYELVISKEAFVEAYNKFIREGKTNV